MSDKKRVCMCQIPNTTSNFGFGIKEGEMIMIHIKKESSKWAAVVEFLDETVTSEFISKKETIEVTGKMNGTSTTIYLCKPDNIVIEAGFVGLEL